MKTAPGGTAILGRSVSGTETKISVLDQIELKLELELWFQRIYLQLHCFILICKNSMWLWSKRGHDDRISQVVKYVSDSDPLYSNFVVAVLVNYIINC